MLTVVIAPPSGAVIVTHHGRPFRAAGSKENSDVKCAKAFRYGVARRLYPSVMRVAASLARLKPSRYSVLETH
jgi:hypothetical protein